MESLSSPACRVKRQGSLPVRASAQQEFAFPCPQYVPWFWWCPAARMRLPIHPLPARIEDAVDQPGFYDEGDDAHGLTAPGTFQRLNLVNTT